MPRIIKILVEDEPLDLMFEDQGNATFDEICNIIFEESNWELLTETQAQYILEYEYVHHVEAEE